ncbi:hypothetical protein IL252_11280 [Halomicrobium sp. IBSBa]|uniref:hypothetical protein n=1 Tax=Halomicrobium sp. IBSBa TaxID=2778916 RepID=UPI001ABF1A43|nr:hypothetical protein [Halomicrobium sp. IBSBa]MBO4248396.1 hypothetical protein [Halomicrobium sp. IBSBa]
MQSATGGSLLGLNLIYLAFLLVPGFMALQGYLRGSVQLDTMSRLDKILSAVVGGSVSLALMLILNRFGVLYYIVLIWYNLVPGGLHYDLTGVLGFSRDYAVMTGSFSETTALSLIGFIFGQSVFAWLAGYLYGTFIYNKEDGKGRLRYELEQPWETAVANGSYGEPIEVITKNGQEIHGRLDRIGSPSEDNDLLLFAATKKLPEKDDEPLGETYHHYRDISQVRFPEMEPSQPDKRGNWLIGFIAKWRSNLWRLREVPSQLRYQYYYQLYRYQLSRKETKRKQIIGTISQLRSGLPEQSENGDIETAIKTAESLKRWFDK